MRYFLKFWAFGVKSLAVLAVIVSTMPCVAFNLTKATPWKKAVVTVYATVSRAAYEPLGRHCSGGFICDLKRGWIVTTHDVVGYGGVVATYEVTFSGGQKLEAQLVYADPSKNFAILKFDPKKLIVEVSEMVQFAESSSLSAEVLLLAKAGEQDIVQQGLVSALYESVSGTPQEAIRISLNASGGRALGGFVVNEKGQVLGLVISQDQTFVSVLRGSFIQDALADLKAEKKPVRRRIVGGLFYSEPLADAVRYSKFPKEELKAFMAKYPEALLQGLVCRLKTTEDSPFMPGDVLVSVDGKDVGPSLYTLESHLNKVSGRTVKVGLFRRGKKIEVEAPLEDLDPFPIRQMVLFGGATFYQADKQLALQFNVPEGAVVVSYALPGSPFANIFPGMWWGSEARSVAVIESIQGYPVASLTDLMGLIPTLLKDEYCELTYRNYAFGVVFGNLITNRGAQLGSVDLSGLNMLPENLSFSDKTMSWTSKPVGVGSQKS
jgi:S1-C subfamily serine protease